MAPESTLYDHSLELRVLATLADVSALDVAEAKNAAERSGLTTEDFHNPLHANIWTAQMGLLFDGEAADFYRAATRMKPDDRGKMPALASRCLEVGVSMLVASTIRGVAQDLRKLTLRRQILRFGRELAHQAESNEDPAVLLSNATAAIARITLSRSANWRTLGEARAAARMEMVRVKEGTGTPVIPTGLKEWDRIVGGLYPTLMVVGAHGGNAKSALLLRMLLNVAQQGHKACIFSLEDQETWLAYRTLAMESGLAQFILRNRELTMEQEDLIRHAEQAMSAYENLVEIDDRGALSPSEIVQAARDAVLNRGAKFVVVDHFGEIRLGEDSKGFGRYDLMIQEGLQDLRNLAKTTGTPVLVAQHLKPGAVYPFTQHDFMNSSAFEKMSRVALMWELDREKSELKMIVCKNQYGKANMHFTLPFHGPSAMVMNEPPTTKAVQEPLL